MQALDNFISPIPDFDDDIPISAIPISSRPPSDESMSDPSVRASASTFKTRAGKQKAIINPIPQKKARKTYNRDQN
jgi:hypothetical protein